MICGGWLTRYHRPDDYGREVVEVSGWSPKRRAAGKIDRRLTGYYTEESAGYQPPAPGETVIIGGARYGEEDGTP